MNTFEQDRADKLKRKPVLRIFSILGMVAWRDDNYGGAKQMLRLTHPLTWVWVAIMVVYGVLGQGIPETIKDIKLTMKLDTVWF